MFFIIEINFEISFYALKK